MFQRIRGFAGRKNIRNIIILTTFLFLSRGLGFVRSSLITTSMDVVYSDLLLASTKVPETIASLLIMGTITSSLLPVSSRFLKSKNKDAVSQYLSLMGLAILSLVIVVILFCIVFTPQILIATTSDQYTQLLDPNGLFNDYVLTTRILLVGPLFFTLQAIFGVYLNIKEQFLVFSWAGAIYNIGTITGLLIGIRNGYHEAAIGMMIGAGVSALLFILESLRHGFTPLKLGSFSHLRTLWKQYKQDIIQTWAVFIPRIFIINGVVFANIFINVVTNNPGQITALDIGLSIQGIFYSLITSVGTVVFPDLAKSFNFDNRSHFWSRIRSYISKTGMVALIATVFTLICAPLVIVLFSLFGKPQPNGEYIVLLARITTVGLVFQSIQEILNKYFYIRERILIPVVISITGIVAQIIGIYTLIGFGFDRGVAVSWGLVLSLAIVCITSFVCIMLDQKKDALQQHPI
jgi:peptidoglycan biosynthesis protein MviN/MurJ (putative lipid II flippase)